VLNFPISGPADAARLHPRAGPGQGGAAEVNAAPRTLLAPAGRAIALAAGDVAGGAHDAQFPVDVYQTGSGTSSNMNANEVIATRRAGGPRSGGQRVHPNDHVNLGPEFQRRDSRPRSRWPVPGDGERLLPALRHLRKTIDRRAAKLGNIVKTGRTHLMDAMPLTMAQEIRRLVGATAIGARRLIDGQLKRLRRLPLGGTAIGTGINADPRFGAACLRRLVEGQRGEISKAGQPVRGPGRAGRRWNCPDSSTCWRWR
jgi:fumarate hydratase class II